MDAFTIESWSERFVASDQNVLEELLSAWSPQLVASLALKYRGVFAEDHLEQLVLEALCAGWIKRPMFDPEKSSLVTWLSRIAQHLAADCAKSLRWRQRCREARFEDFEEDDIAGRDFQTLYDGEDEDDLKPIQSPQMTALLKALAELTSREHDVLLASMDETIHSEDIARELDISESTVRTYRQRAWEKIRRKLRNAGFGMREKGRNAGNRQKSDGAKNVTKAAAPRPRR
jgi:RNA polymerase sigma factor (sigma-70 family)